MNCCIYGPNKLGRATKALHSLVGVAIIFAIACGVGWGGVAHAGNTDLPQVACKRETLSHKYAPMALAWSPDSTMLAAASEVSGIVTLWDVQTAQVVRRFNREFMWGGPLAFGRDGEYLLTSVGGQTDDQHPPAVTLWDVHTGAIAGQIPGPYPDKPLIYNAARLLAVDPERKVLAVMAEQEPGRPVAIYDIARRALTGTVSVVGHTPTTIALGPDASLAAGTIRGQIAFFDVNSGKLLRKIDAGYSQFKAGVDALAYSPDGRFIASGPTKMLYGQQSKTPGPASDAPIRIWSVATGSLTHAYPGSFQGVWSLAWSSNGKYLSSGNDDGVVRLWRVDGGDQPLTITTFRQPAFAVAFSPDSRTLAAAGENRVVICDIKERD